MKKKDPKPKKISDEAQMNKLVKLTQLLKQGNVKATSRNPSKAFSPYNNKWRSQDPKFGSKREPSSNVVDAGGMKVDPSLKDAYEQWRLDKIAEKNRKKFG